MTAKFASMMVGAILALPLFDAPVFAADQTAPVAASEAPAAKPGVAPETKPAVPVPAAIPKERIEAILAPIALYPDAALVQMLMAAAYPDEIVSANTWLKDTHNASLRGADLDAGIEPQQWDPSVKSLAPFPDLVANLAAHPDWTKQLGQAFAFQQADVLAAIQHLRHLARAAHRLDNSSELLVRDQGAVIAISPADPESLYVPIYDATVYGKWPYPSNPPASFPPLGSPTVSGYSVGFGIVPSLWGWAHPGWAAGNVAINIAIWNHINKIGPPWQGQAIWHREAHDVAYWKSGLAFHDEPDRPETAARHPTAHGVTHVEKGHPSHILHAVRAGHPAHTSHSHPSHNAKPHHIDSN